MRKIFIYVITAFGVLLSNCETDNEINRSFTIDQSIIIDNDLFINAPNDEFDFTNAEIIGDSLILTLRYGGGCGDIKIKLIDSGSILESYPLQRNLRLSFKDDDSCEALLIKVISFDLKPIRVSNNDTISLNLAGWNNQLLYKY